MVAFKSIWNDIPASKTLDIVPEKKLLDFVAYTRKARIRRTRKRTATKLRSYLDMRRIVKRQEADTLENVQVKLDRVLQKFHELGYKMSRVTSSGVGSDRFEFDGTHGINGIRGSIRLLVKGRGQFNDSWSVGSFEEPVVQLESRLVKRKTWQEPRVLLITYRTVMRTTNEILQVLLEKKK